MDERTLSKWVPAPAVSAGADAPKILVVDDERRNRALIGAYLAPTYAVIEAASGPEALELLAREPVDLVLLDVMMPALSGFETCREIKARTLEGFLPVILVTSLSDQEDRNTGLAVGADEFLSKPVNRTELRLRVRAFLEIRRQEALIRRQLADLRQLQELKDDLIALVLHDIRNPLSGIDGYLGLLSTRLDGGADAKVRRAIEGLTQSAKNLHDIVDGVLDVKLLESGELAPRREPVAVGALIGEAVAALAGAGEARAVRLATEIEGDPRGHLDRRLTRRLVENLISNAIKYTPDGATVLVRARAGAGAVEIEVADRGPGIPDAMKAGVFEKFVTVEGRTGVARRGYGLGLHLVKLAAAVHGGAVAVYDREGGGSIFRVTLPAEPRAP